MNIERYVCETKPFFDIGGIKSESNSIIFNFSFRCNFDKTIRERPGVKLTLSSKSKVYFSLEKFVLHVNTIFFLSSKTQILSFITIPLAIVVRMFKNAYFHRYNDFLTGGNFINFDTVAGLSYCAHNCNAQGSKHVWPLYCRLRATALANKQN